MERDDDDLLYAISIELGEIKFQNIQELENTEIKANLVKTFRDFLKSLLEKLLEYFPIEDKLIQGLSFLSLDDAKDNIKKNIHQLNRVYGIVLPEDEKFISGEVNDLKSQQINWIRKESNSSSLKFWNLIEQTFNQRESDTNQTKHRFPILSKIFRTIHSFAPSSANVEQCFSILKLLKSNIRNSLREETLESLVLIHEEFKDGKHIEITDRLLALYDEMKQKMNENKSRSKSSQIIQEEVEHESPSQQVSQLNHEEVKVNKNYFDETTSITYIKQDEELDSISKILEESLVMEIEEEISMEIIQPITKQKKSRPHENVQITPEDTEDPTVKPIFKNMKLNPK